MFVITRHNQAAASALFIKASNACRYAGSPYHRRRDSMMGGATADRTWPDASKCPPFWTREAATRALKEAIRIGQVSADWQNGFPRFAWIRHDDVLYEARLSNSGLGEYHAYPLEDAREWPKQLRQSAKNWT
jgi:hypothetical protein